MQLIRASALVLLSLIATAQADTVEYLHTDVLGNVVAVTDENANVIERRVYEPCGLPTAPIADGPGYTGHVHDGASGLIYMQQRYYDPMVGRFLSIDPAAVNGTDGTNFNRYWYGNNNPYKHVDPDGELAFLIPVAIIAYRAYSAYDTATSTVANVQTLADSEASVGDKAVAGAELVGSILGGKVGRQAAGGVARAAGKADAVTQSTSRAARRDSMRQANNPTSRGSTEQRYNRESGHRQHVTQDSGGNPRIQTQHGADAQHPNPHWHNAEPKAGMQENDHGQIKYKSGGTTSEYKERDGAR